MRDLESQLKEAVENEISQRFKTPFLSHSHPLLYELLTSIASSAKERVYLLSRSLNLITGARPYTSDVPEEYEKAAFDYFWDLAKKAAKGDIKFFAATIVPKTVKELADPVAKEKARRNLKSIFRYCSKKNPESQFVLAMPCISSNPYLGGNM